MWGGINIFFFFFKRTENKPRRIRMSEEPTRTSVVLARLPARGSPVSKIRVFHPGPHAPVPLVAAFYYSFRNYSQFRFRRKNVIPGFYDDLAKSRALV